MWFARLTSNLDWETRYDNFKEALRLEAKMTVKDRYRLNMAASVLFAGELAVELGIVRYDMAPIRAWVISEIQKVREDAKVTKQSPSSIVSAYIAAHWSSTISSQADKLFASDVKGAAIVARVYEKDDVIIVTEAPFRRWCAANNHNIRSMSKELGPKIKSTTANIMAGIVGGENMTRQHVYKFTGLGIPVLQDQQPTEEKEENV
jgi:hypothetical protein